MYPLVNSISSLIVWLETTPVHPSLFPYPWLTTIHAARMTIGFRDRLKSKGNSDPLFKGPSIAGYLITCWAGGFIAHFLMRSTPPQLLSIHPYINYLSVNILLHYILDRVSISSKYIDTALPIFDAIGRTGGIASVTLRASTHSDPAISSSLFFQVLMGVVVSAGGTITAVTLGVWDSDWSLRTPSFLRGGHIQTLDIWAGALITALYGCLMGLHPGYAPFAKYLSKGEEYKAGTPLMQPLEARSVCVLFLASIFAYRIYKVHYCTAAGAKPPAMPIAKSIFISTKEKSE